MLGMNLCLGSVTILRCSDMPHNPMGWQSIVATSCNIVTINCATFEA